MRQVKVDSKLKERIEKGYRAIAKSNGKDTTEYEKQLLRLEKRLVESALGITLNNEEVEDLKVIGNVKAVFPNSKVVGVSDKGSRRKNHGKGGEIEIGITIEAEKPVEPGMYDVKIAKVDAKEGKFGTRLQVTFELPDGRSVNGFFAPKATVNNKTGRLFEKALGKQTQTS